MQKCGSHTKADLKVLTQGNRLGNEQVYESNPGLQCTQNGIAKPSLSQGGHNTQRQSVLCA